MKNQTRCEACNKLTNSLRVWFGKYLCLVCYEKERYKPQTILFGNSVEENYFRTMF